MTETDVETFIDRNLRGARFIRSVLSGAVMRGVDVDGLDIDAPWLPDGVLLVNGVDVAPFVEAELNRRFPGRELRKAKDPQACYNLADSAETGVGVKQDDKRALQLFDQACRMGHAEGCKRAALLRQGPK